ncbi:ATP-binding cassette, sub-B (MDR TAP), member 4 [Asimina triloba]
MAGVGVGVGVGVLLYNFILSLRGFFVEYFMHEWLSASAVALRPKNKEVSIPTHPPSSINIICRLPTKFIIFTRAADFFIHIGCSVVQLDNGPLLKNAGLTRVSFSISPAFGDSICDEYLVLVEKLTDSLAFESHLPRAAFANTQSAITLLLQPQEIGIEHKKSANPALAAMDEEIQSDGHARPTRNSAVAVSRGKSTETQELKDPEKSQKEDLGKNTVPIYKLFAFADSTDVLLMIVGTVAAVGNGLSFPLMAVLFGDMVNSFGQTTDVHDVVRKVSKLCPVPPFHITTLFKYYIKQDVAFFDKQTNTGEVISRMSGDTVLIQDAMGEKVGKFIQLISTFIGGFVVAFIRGWLLTLVMLSSIPPLVVSGAVMAIIVSNMASRGQTAYAESGIVVEQTIGSIRTVASFTGEKLAIKKYIKSLKNAYNSGVQQGLAAGLGLGSLIYALAVWFGSKMIIHNGYTGGDVVNVIIAVLTGSMSLGQASPCLSAFAAGQAAAYKMLETIKRKPDIDASDTRGKKLDDIRGDVELRDVYFSYPARPDEQIFTGFSLSIPSGTNAALVGESGSGKSTVISLIERFYDPQAGEVLIDGINLKEFQLRWIREKIGLVSQEPVLFTSSIKENIAYGKEGATLEEIKAAVELANAAKFIDKMPLGLDTMVGEHGTQLSGGQKQRIAIARAILKNPRILLLDEATSALDAESERIVQEALDRIMVNRTTVIVAHRLTTVRNADMIAVIHRGLIVEKGNHLELLKIPDGAYCQLIRLQEMKKETDNSEKPETSTDAGRQSSQQLSIRRSISQGSSGGPGSSGHHSFSVSFGIPTGMNIQEIPTSVAEDAPQPLQPQQEVPLRRLASLNKPEIPVLLFGSIAAIVSGVIFPIYGILISSMIKTFYEPHSKMRKDSRFWAFMFIILGLASLLSHPLQTYFFAIAGCKLIKRIRTMTFEKLAYMEIGWFDCPENSSGAVGARLSVDAASVRCLVGDTLALTVQNLASMVAGLAIAFEASWQLALIILAMLPLIGLSGFFHLKFMQGFSADAKVRFQTH